MANEPAIATVEQIDSMILTVRGQRVMLDSDLARIYGVNTKHLNQQVRRNRERFPNGFAFELNPREFARMRSQIVTASKRNIRHRPVAFTEHGAIMLAMVLKSAIAVEAGVRHRASVRLPSRTIGNRPGTGEQIRRAGEAAGQTRRAFGCLVRGHPAFAGAACVRRYESRNRLPHSGNGAALSSPGPS